MKRVLVRTALLIALAIAMTVPLWDTSDGSASSEPTTITNYAGDFTVSASGQLRAVETLTVDFPAGQARHGIFRFFDTWANTGHRPPMVPSDIAVTQDGRPAKTDISWDHRRRIRTVKIGDADRYLTPGPHVYRISYRLDHVLTEAAEGARTQFAFDLIPSGWLQPIDRAELTVRLPAAPRFVETIAGSQHSRVPGKGSSTLDIRTGALPPGTPVRLRAGLDIPTPPQPAQTPWTTEWRGVLGHSVPALITVVLLGVAASLAGWRISATVRERRPGYPLQYAPPEGIGPAQAYYVMHEAPSKHGYLASLMYAAEKGALQLEQGEKGAWTVRVKRKDMRGVDRVTAKVGELGLPGGEFVMHRKDAEAGAKLQLEMKQFDDELAQWALTSKLLATEQSKLVSWLILAFALLAVNVVWNPLRMSVLDLIPGLLIVFGSGVIAPGSGTRRTAEGRDMWSRVGGFQRVLSTPSSEQRFDFAGRKDLYAAYLPWAVVFGCADAWAHQYRVEMGAEPPTPSFFTGYVVGSTASVGSLTDSFSSSLSAAVSAYSATQHSSSGGGFSGGSFGGGGGGSW